MSTTITSGRRLLLTCLPRELGEKGRELPWSLVGEHGDRDGSRATRLGLVHSTTLQNGALTNVGRVAASLPLRSGMHDLLESLWRTSTHPIGSVRSVSSDEPIVVLTFDDGPSPDSTEGLLGALAEFDASATFFVLLTRVHRSPDLLAAIVGAGHEVGLHGPDHAAPHASCPFREVVERTRAAKLELEDLTGQPVRWMRPPYGSQNLRSWAAVRRAGLMPVMWGGTTWDWKDESMERRMAKVTSALAPGQIVLAHDTIAGVDDGADPRPAFDLDRGAFIRTLLGVYREQGISAVSLGAAVAGGASLQRWAWFGG